MSDTTLNKFVTYGTAAERAAFTPDPPSGVNILYVWYETDTGKIFVYHGSWVEIETGGGSDGIGLQFAGRNVSWIIFTATSNTVSFQGFSVAPGTSGTGSPGSTAAERFRRFTSGASVGNPAGQGSLSTAEIFVGQDFDFYSIFKTGPSITNLRLWSGVSSGAPAGNTDDPTGQWAYIKYSTVLGDDGFRAYTKSSTATDHGKIADIAADTTYVARIRRTGGSIFFSINGGTEIEATTELPALNMGIISVVIFTQETSGKVINISRAVVYIGSEGVPL